MNPLPLWTLLTVGSVPVPAPPESPAPPTSIVVLTTGEALRVRSYRCDGPLVRIVAADGTALVLKAALFDEAASRELTRRDLAAQRHRAAIEAGRAPSSAAPPAAPPRRPPLVVGKAAATGSAAARAAGWAPPLSPGLLRWRLRREEVEALKRDVERARGKR
jgi:hypothetical protein